MATLTSTIKESVIIEGENRGSSVTKSIAGVNDSFSAFVEVPQATEITLYSASAARTGVTGFNWTNVKYSRITNMHATRNVDLIVANSDNHEFIIKLGPGQSYVFWDHAADIFEANGSAIGLASGAVGTTGAAQTVADGDAANGMTEGQYLQLINTEGLVKNYVISDTNAGGAVTGTVLESGTDIGSNNFGTLTTAVTTGVAVGFNKSTATQNAALVQLKAAIEHANGHNGTITVSAVPGEADGAQSITFTQVVAGAAGNTVTTEDIVNFTSADFASGVDYGAANAEDISSINAIPETGAVRLEVFVATA